MSNNFDRGSKAYSEYDSMSTEQLQEILRLDAHCTDGIGMDTDELFYIMEVLAEREKNNGTNPGKTAQEAYETFRKHYLPQEEPQPDSRRPIAKPLWLPKAAAVAAILALLITATVHVDANGFNLWGKVAQWTQDFFCFEDPTQGTEGTEPDTSNQLEYQSLQEVLNYYNISQRLAPTWMPTGYHLDEIEFSRTPKEVSIYAYYKNGEAELVISIRRLVGSAPEDIEISDSLVEAYEANGVTYYIINNYEELKAAWVVEEYECFISARITIEEIKEIIDSI